MPISIHEKSQIISGNDSRKSDRHFHYHNRQLKDFIQSALAEVDIHINGDRPWDMQVHNEKFYQRVLRGRH